MSATSVRSHPRIMNTSLKTYIASTNAIPHHAGAAPNISNHYVALVRALQAIPQDQPDVHVLARGWDAISTHPEGMQLFVQELGAGAHPCKGHINFTFVFFQMREFTSAALQAEFGLVHHLLSNH
jgi:hypothetical protein